MKWVLVLSLLTGIAFAEIPPANTEVILEFPEKIKIKNYHDGDFIDLIVGVDNKYFQRGDKAVAVIEKETELQNGTTRVVGTIIKAHHATLKDGSNVSLEGVIKFGLVDVRGSRIVAGTTALLFPPSMFLTVKGKRVKAGTQFRAFTKGG